MYFNAFKIKIYLTKAKIFSGCFVPSKELNKLSDKDLKKLADNLYKMGNLTLFKSLKNLFVLGGLSELT